MRHHPILTRPPLAFFAAALLSANAFAQMCTPNQPLPPCAQGGAAAQAGDGPVLPMGIGNPVHLATGNKHQKETDLPEPMLAPGLELVRYYNALDPSSGSGLGTGWRMGYDTRLQRRQDGIHIRQTDGSSLRLPHPSSVAQAADGMKETADGWQWRWPSGRQLRFDKDGRLIGILPESGASIQLVRHDGGPLDGLLAEVRQAGLSLQFHYAMHGQAALLHAVDTPRGRFRYVFEHLPADPAQGLAALSRLSLVHLPNGSRRRYLYEARHQSGNRGLVTGIVQESPNGSTQRLNAWDYDKYGRATGVATGERSAADGYSRIRYLRAATETAPGLTEVRSAQGITQLRFLQRQGRYLLSSVHGDGCGGCPPSGTSAAYDAQGRLQAVNGTQLMRDADGEIVGISPASTGWPGLMLHYHPSSGDSAGWQSALTGRETLRHLSDTRSLVRRFANGDTATLHYDAAGLPVSLTQTGKGRSQQTTLGWNEHRQPIRIANPAETESRQYDGHGRMTLRRTERPLPDGTIWRMEERFHYDAQHRLLRHELSEGGMLHYRWGSGKRLLSLIWENRRGERQTVIASDAGRPGYRYGNGLRLQVRLSGRHHRTLQVSRETPPASKPLWRLTQTLNPDGSVRRQHQQVEKSTALPRQPQSLRSDWHYLHDAQRRLVTAKDPGAATTYWYAWDDSGALASSLKLQADAPPERTLPAIPRDPSGLPLSLDGYELSYGPSRRLEYVSRNGARIASHTHNAFGHRIRLLSAARDTHFLYTGNRLTAEAASQGAGYAPRVTRRYLYAGHVPVGLIDYAADSLSSSAGGSQDALYSIHADLTGTPHLVTDARQQVRWHAAYSPLGQLQTQSGDLDFPLRQPGHYADADTGWHDNLLRTYHPGLGQYLEPDPIGPVPGSQALGYAAQQPQRFVDPMGLLLFAFDGTRHNHRTGSNIWLLSQAYQGGAAYYHSGPGNPYYPDLDAAIGHSAPQIIETQWQHLLNALHASPSSPAPTPIDIIGFSRGAALALHFGNLIASHTDQGLFSYEDPLRGSIRACVDLRFMGLLDTVTQFGPGGAHNDRYSLAVADAWRWVAHAVALNEHRSLFPLTSLENSENLGIVQQPFIGAHADLGGGNTLDEPGARQGDLSDMALLWLWSQARAMSVPFAELAAALRQATEPLLNDSRSTLQRQSDTDRRVDQEDGKTAYARQDLAPLFGRLPRTAVEAFIERAANWRNNASPVVGLVDMALYEAWLRLSS